MKKINYCLIIGILFSLTVWVGVLFAETKNIGESKKVIYTPLDTQGALITGQTVALRIEKSSNSYTWNFANSTFDNTTNNDTVNLTEGTYFYYYTWTPDALETSQEQYNFTVTNANTTYADTQTESVSYLDIPNRAEVIGSSNDTLESLSVQLDAIGDATDGDKEAGSYTGIESMIRRN